MRQKREMDDLFKDWDKIAYLTPGAEGYSTVGFDLGVVRRERRVNVGKILCVFSVGQLRGKILNH